MGRVADGEYSPMVAYVWCTDMTDKQQMYEELSRAGAAYQPSIVSRYKYKTVIVVNKQ